MAADARPARLRRAVAVLGAAALLAGGTGGCSHRAKQTPAEIRHDRVEARLRATFSAAQARCVLAALDEPTIAALARGTRLAAGGTELARYSGAVASCVTGARATSTTSATSTTAGSTPSTTGSSPTTTG